MADNTTKILLLVVILVVLGYAVPTKQWYP